MSALFTFLERTAGATYSPRSLVFKVGAGEGSMSIGTPECSREQDAVSSKSLELVYNSRSTKSKQHLLGAIDHTLTKMGRRLLRLCILQPLNDMQSISVRQDCVAEILENEEAYHALREALTGVPDIDQIVSAVVRAQRIEGPKNAEHRVHLLLSLKSMLAVLAPISNALSGLRHPLFAVIARSVDNDTVRAISGTLEGTIDGDVCYRRGQSAMTQQQRAFAVKGAANTLLEVARRTFKETVSDIHEYASALSRSTSAAPFRAPRHAPPGKAQGAQRIPLDSQPGRAGRKGIAGRLLQRHRDRPAGVHHA